MNEQSAGIVEEASPIQERASKGGFEHVMDAILTCSLATAK